MRFSSYFVPLVVCPLLVLGADWRHSSQRVTTLSRPQETYQVVAEHGVEIRWGKLAARLVNNQAVPPDHAAGYNGLASLRYERGVSPFVPRFAGLNLEHINNGVSNA